MLKTQSPSLRLENSAPQIRVCLVVKIMSIFVLSVFISAAMVAVTEGTKFDLANEINVSEPVER